MAVHLNFRRFERVTKASNFDAGGMAEFVLIFRPTQLFVVRFVNRFERVST
jgi:hypothetical protein